MRTVITLFALALSAVLHAQNPNDSVFVKVDQMPEFPGGQSGMLKYINSVSYPAEAKERGIEGTTHVKFVVDSSGSLINVDVQKTSGSAMLDSAAVAHVKGMPNWNPGYQSGTWIKMQYIVPVKFALGGTAPKPQPKTKKKK